MLIVASIALFAVLVAAVVAARRRSHRSIHSRASAALAADRARREIGDARIDAAREKGKQWY